jgi:uncharacterized integral membrane protein (TIGR00698 family)
MEQAVATLPAVAEPAAPRTRLSEDWVSVLVAAALVGAVLSGIGPAVPAFAWSGVGELGGRLLSGENLQRALELGALLLVPIAAGAFLLGSRLPAFLPGFGVLYLLAWLAQAVAGNAAVSGWGLEYVLFALAIGLAISHTSGVPEWLLPAVRTEFYIKTGLVVLGASILFDDIVRAGLLGIAQAVVVILSVWFFSFWLARRLRIDDELNTMMATAVSICGVSAAIAACGAIQGDRKKLSYVTSLVLVVAMPMMVVMPWIARATGMPELVAGAWLGGTLDTSAAVVAGGELISEAARDAAVVVKLSQNALIGVAAFLLTVWWTFRQQTPAAPGTSAAVIWERFPKFVLGFVAASLFFSFALDGAVVGETRGLLTGIRTVLFAMAFVSIGLETSVTSLVKTDDGRPAVAFLGGQTFNVVVTLLMAYLLFGGGLFALPVLD